MILKWLSSLRIKLEKLRDLDKGEKRHQNSVLKSLSEIRNVAECGGGGFVEGCQKD